MCSNASVSCILLFLFDFSACHSDISKLSVCMFNATAKLITPLKKAMQMKKRMTKRQMTRKKTSPMKMTHQAWAAVHLFAINLQLSYCNVAQERAKKAVPPSFVPFCII